MAGMTRGFSCSECGQRFLDNPGLDCPECGWTGCVVDLDDDDRCDNSRDDEERLHRAERNLLAAARVLRFGSRRRR